MHYLITGAGQIGRQLAADLSGSGHEATVLRRGTGTVPGARVRSGDAGDRAELREAASGAAAILHCIHAPYSARAWRQQLPQREQAVMDVAAELGIPVVFPESVYAFGHGARHLAESSPIAPVSPLGEVRAELLAARAEHPALTASVVASDLVGPTAVAQSSAIVATVLAPATTGRRVWAMGDPDAPHAVTSIPDLARALIAAIALASADGTVLTAPTPAARSQRDMARDAARTNGPSDPTVSPLPRAILAAGGIVSPMLRELARQHYLWAAPSEIRPGRLTTELGLSPTPWDLTLAEWHAAR